MLEASLCLIDRQNPAVGIWIIGLPHLNPIWGQKQRSPNMAPLRIHLKCFTLRGRRLELAQPRRGPGGGGGGDESRCERASHPGTPAQQSNGHSFKCLS